MKTLLQFLFLVVTLNPAFAAFEPFCVGESVISSNGITGRIVGIYPDGRLSVRYRTSSSLFAQESSQLARTYGESNGFQVGDDVISSNGINGVVKGIYQDGRLSVKYVTKNDYLAQDAYQLASTRGESNGFFVGDEVISSNGVSGIVKGVYQDGRLSVKYVTKTDNMIQSSNQLAHTGRCSRRCRG